MRQSNDFTQRRDYRLFTRTQHSSATLVFTAHRIHDMAPVFIGDQISSNSSSSFCRMSQAPDILIQIVGSLTHYYMG